MSFVQACEVYQIRWNIEVLNKECKQYLGLGKCLGRDFDEQIADSTLCFLTYITMALEKRFSEYETMGELFSDMKEDLMALTLWKRVLTCIKRLLEVLCEHLGVTVDEMTESLVNDEEAASAYLIIMAKALEDRDKASVVDCKKARQLAERLEAEIMETAQLADNKAYAEFAKRALANGYRKALVLYLANGEKWEKSIEDFIEWSVKYDLWCKMRFFGMKMDEAIDSDRRLVSHSGPSNLLSFVPDTFSLMDILVVYQMQGKKGRLSALLAMWLKRGHIVKNVDGTYSKTERFIAKYGHYGTPMAA